MEHNGMPHIFAETDKWIFVASTIVDGPMNVPPNNAEGDAPEFLEKTRDVFGPLLPTVRSYQTACLCHGDTIAEISNDATSRFYDNTDGLIVETPRVALRVTGADCPPVFLVDESQGRIALLHSGRKGTLKDIVGKAVKKMNAAGSDAGNVTAIIGPGVCGHHYQMPPEILAEFSGYPEAISGTELSLRRVIRTQLMNVGVLPENIRDIDECTFEMPEKWFSYRRDTHEGLKFERPRVQAFVAMLK